MDQVQTYSSKKNNGLIIFLTSLIIFIISVGVSYFLYKNIAHDFELINIELESASTKISSLTSSANQFNLLSSELLLSISNSEMSFKDKVAHACSSVENSTFCYYKAGVVFEDPDLCSLAGGANLKDECYMNIALENKNADVCNSINKSDNKIRCLAATNNDPDLCQQITDTLQQTYCIQDTASTQQAAEACTMLPYDNDYNRNICYSKIARINKDVSYCDIICDEPVDENRCESSRVSWRDSCYMKVGIVSVDESICSQISNNDEKNYCYALTKMDSSYCEKILLDESYKYNCDIITKSNEPVDFETLFGP
jgi:hypothetical protein